MWRVALAVALNLVAAAIYVVVALQLKFFDHLSYTLFWSPDSHTYRDVAQWLIGAGPNPAESQHRPFLYPLLLAVAQRIGGDPGAWALNLVCWLGMVNLASLAAHRLTGRVWVAVIVFLVLATNASLIVLSFQALTEPLTALLESAWMLGLSAARLPPSRPRDALMLVLPLSLLTVVRPQFEIELLIALAVMAVIIARLARGRARLTAAVVACCLPVVFQVALMTAANHMVAISSSGEAE